MCYIIANFVSSDTQSQGTCLAFQTVSGDTLPVGMNYSFLHLFFNHLHIRVTFSAMDATPPSFQTLLEPYQQLVAFKAHLEQTRLSLAHLATVAPNFLPDAREWVNMATALLERIDPQLQRMESQLLAILQIQLQYAISNHGHLPILEED